MAKKKFRVRLKEYKTNELIGNENTVEYGDLFVEHRPLGTRFLLKHGTENNTNPRALKNIVNQKGFNYVDSGLHVIDAKQFAEYLKGDINGVKVVNLDNYIEGGFYYIRGEANTGKKDEGVILKNSPYSIGLDSNEVNGSEFAGYLQVIEWNSNHCKQIFLKQANDQIFVREKIGENWSTWKEILTSAEIKTGRVQITKDAWKKNSDNIWECKGTIEYIDAFKERTIPYVTASIATSKPLKARVSIDLTSDEKKRNAQFDFVAHRDMNDADSMSFYWIASLVNNQFDTI